MRNNADFPIVFAVANEDGSPYDLTGATLEMQIKKQHGPTAAATFSTDNGLLIILAPASNGRVALAVPFTVMETIDPGLYWWDLLVLISDSSRLSCGGGKWRINPGITEGATPSFPVESDETTGEDITLTVQNPEITLTLAAQGPPGRASVAVTNPTVQTASFALTGNYDYWLIDASAGDVVVTVPAGAGFPDRKWNLVRVDAGLAANGHNVTIMMSVGEVIMGVDTPVTIDGGGENLGIKNLGGGTKWVVG